MIKKVYLLWNSYTTNELLVIGSLKNLDNNYIFKYDEEAVKAMQDGCMLPFIYTKEEYYCDSLPKFFAQRMINNDMLQKLDIDCDLNDELSILTALNGRRNNDNFLVVREEVYQALKGNNNSKII